MNRTKAERNPRTPSKLIRGQILEAAHGIVEERGYDAFTIRLLSERAGVSPGSIYRNIGGKKEVITTLIDDSFLTLREELLHVVTADPLERIYQAGLVYRDHAERSPEEYQLLWQWRMGKAAEECLAVIAELIRYGQAAGKLRDTDPQSSARAIWSSVHGFMMFELRSAHKSDDASKIDSEDYDLLLRLLIRGLAKNPDDVDDITVTIADIREP